MKHIKETVVYNNIIGIENVKDEIKDFYKYIREPEYMQEINFTGDVKIDEIKNLAIEYSNAFHMKYDKYIKIQKYQRLIEVIKTSSKMIGINTIEERYLFFMFCIDPNLEIATIYGESTNKDEIKHKMISKFGLYEPYIIKIENYYIKNYMNKKDKEDFNSNPQKRIFS